MLNDLGQVKLVEGADLGGNYAQHHSHVAALLKDVHAEAPQAGDPVGHIQFGGFFELLLLAVRHHAEGHVQHVFSGDARLVGERNQLAIHAEIRVVAHF